MKIKRTLIQICLLCAVLLQAITSGAQSVTKITAGGYHSLFLRSDGSLWGMGNNYVGQLGDGTYNNTNRPEQIVASGVTAIVAGDFHSLFLKSDGSLWAMGYNESGQLGNGTYNSTNQPEQIVASGVTAIAAGEGHSLFLKSDGSLWGMGDNYVGQLGDGTYNNVNLPKQIVASGVTAIAAGDFHSLFLKSDGSLWVMGYNELGQLGDGTYNSTNQPELIVTNGVTAIAAGGEYSLFLKSDGSLWAVGDNGDGELGDGTYNNTNLPEQIVASGVTAIAAGNFHSLFLKNDGSLWAVGNNSLGQLGDGTPSHSQITPKQIMASNVTAIVAGNFHSLFLKSDGSLWGMGYNGDGELGDGTYHNVNLPKQIVAGSPANAAPIILTQPTDQTAFVGGAAGFLVVAGGTPPLSYQWNFNGINIAGATNSSLILTNVQASQAGNYTLLVTNACGSALSSNAMLTVNPSLPCIDPPGGLVAWWKGDGNALDSAGTNNGVIQNITYTSGIVGQAFACGSGGHVQIADSPAFQLTNTLSIECWVRPRGNGYTIFWRGDHRPGLDPYALSMNGSDNRIYFYLEDEAGNYAAIGANINSGQWSHVAATWDGETGLMNLYVNGQLASQTNTPVRPFGMLNPNENPAVGIGNTVGDEFPFIGDIDEVSLYNRVLAANEVASIYNAGSGGKCTFPSTPVITTQPASQVVAVGGMASFSVAAGGSLPLSYQWNFNGMNIAGATNSSLTLTNVQLNQAGNYAVLVANAYGLAFSSNAILTVNSAPPCVPPPAGLVSWWPAEGNANERVHGYNGIPQDITYAAGEVNQAFVFNGSSSFIRVPANSNLDLGLGDGLTMEVWINPADSSFQSICEWNHNGSYDSHFSGGQIGAHLELNEFNADGSLWGNLIDTSGNAHVVSTAGGVITDNTWQHVAMTYDKAGGMAVLYCNGVAVASTNLGTFTPQTSSDFFMGHRPAGPFSGLYFNGKMDEVSVYNRALTAVEIQALYNAGSGGKCTLSSAPVIATQPTGHGVAVGGMASFSVAAGGSPPLSYQWNFNGTNIAGATNSSLTLTNVQLNQVGNYAVLVANAFGSVLSSNAMLWIQNTYTTNYTFITNSGTITITGYTGPGGAVTIPDTINGLPVTAIGDYAFWQCANLVSVTIPNSITRIGDFAFAECGALTDVTMGDSLTSIGWRAFVLCTNLSSITIPRNVDSIGDSAFLDCDSLTTITVDPLNSFYTSVDGVLFGQNQTKLIQCPGRKAGSYIVPNSVTSIGSNAFFRCANLICVTIPNSVTNIEGGAFGICASLTGVTIGNSVTSIGDLAFWHCASLTNITIPNSVTGIGEGAFADCTNLTSVYFKGNAPSLPYPDSFVFYDDDNVTVYYLPGTTGWGTTYEGRPTALWTPQVQPGGASFGVRTNQFGFDIKWANGMVVVVEACTNLTNPVWLPVQTNTLTGGSCYFSDPAWTNYPGRFYRLRSP